MPRSVVVVGASRKPGAIGHRVLNNLLGYPFQGPVFAVNPRAECIEGTTCYTSVRELPDAVDLAIIATPAATVPGVLEDCVARGVPAAVVISAGFSEAGPDGVALQQQIKALITRSGIRVVGPNCLGIINTDPAVRLNASFSQVLPPVGNIALSSQSGGVAVAALTAARRFGLGLSGFASVGNKVDVSGNDLLEFWEQDPRTAVILLYLESFGNPRRFSKIARRVGRTKPVIALKGGRSQAGSRAAQSHTAALAARGVAVDALFRQSGVVRVETLEELFDAAAVLSLQPLAPGPRVGIVTNAGGPGILAADACEAAGLVVPPTSHALRTALTGILPAAAGFNNPIDMIASATPEQYEKVIALTLASSDFDALIVEYIAVGQKPADIRAAIARGVGSGRRAGAKDRPVVACFMVEESMAEVPAAPGEESFPMFEFPEAAARALGRAVQYADWRRQPAGVYVDSGNRFNAARTLCEAALRDRGPGWLSATETRQLLASAGFQLPGGGTATSADEAVALARQIGGPVAIKLASRVILHKSDVGGVRLGLLGDAAIRSAFDEIREAAIRVAGADAFDGVVVQPMVGSSVEIVAGMTHDPSFGPLIMFGLGGIHVEVLADVCFRIAPLSDHDAAEMVRSIRGYRLLEGYRGHPRCDVAALERMLLDLSGLVEAVPVIAELDFNPVMALAEGSGTVIVDARIRLA
ncbi:MAG: acetate--CoA ligase family protein [Gemmataceae bacterium]|nr:acetate--CoA ligase family protein [Gemmataceae bacterium]